ncbi:MAG: CDP-glycerol glycerophosphotransferase family protein, partial [Treponemataceae bacterium]|nr:CDP-glycerol glycerophosphotransferase family protein [Treponemataceae bacterium]
MIKENKRNLPVPLKIIRRAFISLFSLFLLPLYYLIGVLPRSRSLWIFCSWFGQRYSDNSRLLFEYVNQHCPDVRAVWLSKDMSVVAKVRERGMCAYSVCSLRVFVLLLRAGKIFSTTGGEIPLFFCRGADYYALWHGMPLKRILEDDGHSG